MVSQSRILNSVEEWRPITELRLARRRTSHFVGRRRQPRSVWWYPTQNAEVQRELGFGDTEIPLNEFQTDPRYFLMTTNIQITFWNIPQWQQYSCLKQTDSLAALELLKAALTWNPIPPAKVIASLFSCCGLLPPYPSFVTRLWMILLSCLTRLTCHRLKPPAHAWLYQSLLPSLLLLLLLFSLFLSQVVFNLEDHGSARSVNHW